MGEWISVKDRLPEHGQMVDVYVPEHRDRRTSCYYIKEDESWLWRASELKHRVSHWMPLPKKPPDGRKDEG